MVEVKRKKGESFESLLRRFTRRVQMSGSLLQAKKVRFHTKAKNKNKMHSDALRRIKIREEREQMIRTGEITEEELRAQHKGGRR
jgi:ribosomal protein S21